MNERIRELARTAEREVQISLGERWTTVGRAEFMRLYNLKFAELIVRECISNLEFHGHDAAVDQLEWFRRKHFGVE